MLRRNYSSHIRALVLASILKQEIIWSSGAGQMSDAAAKTLRELNKLLLSLGRPAFDILVTRGETIESLDELMEKLGAVE